MADIQVANTDADLSGNTVVTEENAYTITGLHTYSRSTNAPFACISGAAVVTYLDADKLDGQEGAYYLAAANITGTALASNVVTSSLTAVGTIATGVWQGTDVGVAYGGTGVSTLTDGYVLLGSGTGAITPLDVTADGAILIGDGSGDPTTLDVGSSTGITILGTIATGVWNGTAVTVAYGGTGASTLTDGGVLLGSGTGAITAMSVLADSEMIVGNGSTDPVAESGADLRTSIGVGTGDSPTFTGLTVSGTGASALDVGGGINVGTGDVSLVGTDGRINGPLSSTIIDDLDGSNLTTLTAGNISSGTVPTARLGSGTASSSTFLRGDSSWTAASTSAAGSDTQIQFNDGGTAFGGDAGLTYDKDTDSMTLERSAGEPTLDISTWSTTDAHRSLLVFQKSANATIDTLAETASGENLGIIEAKGVHSGSAVAVSSSIAFAQDAAADGDSVPGRMVFSTSSLNGIQEVMRMNDSQYVGIGEQSPTTKLHISDEGPNSIITLDNRTYSIDGNDVLGAIHFALGNEGNISTHKVRAKIESTSGGSTGAANIRFYTGPNADTEATEKMRLAANGHLGIGLLGGHPAYLLDVNGDANFVGAVSKGSGSFKIDHPLPAKADTHHLIHSFVESPETLLIYRGSVTLVAGQATVDLDDAAGMTTGTWVLICRDEQCFTSNETGWFHVRGSVTGSTLTIDCEEATCTDTVSWMVVANRKDSHIMDTAWTDENGYPIVEPEKVEEEEEV